MYQSKEQDEKMKATMTPKESKPKKKSEKQIFVVVKKDKKKSK